MAVGSDVTQVAHCTVPAKRLRYRPNIYARYGGLQPVPAPSRIIPGIPGHKFAPSRGANGVRGMKGRCPENEGTGKAGCPSHPRPVCIGRKHTVVTTGIAGIIRPSLRNGFNGLYVISLATGLSCHHHRRDAKHPMQSIIADLTPASGRRDHTTSPSAPRAARPATPIRPPHPASTFVTTRTPLVRGGMDIFKSDLGSRRSGIFLGVRLDRANHVDPARQIRFCAHGLCSPERMRQLSR